MADEYEALGGRCFSPAGVAAATAQWTRLSGEFLQLCTHNAVHAAKRDSAAMALGKGRFDRLLGLVSRVLDEAAAADIPKPSDEATIQLLLSVLQRG